MKSAYSIPFLLLMACLLCFLEAYASKPYAEQKIKYYAPGMSEVLLVWGIDGWRQIPDDKLNNVQIVDGLIYSPMLHENDTFYTSIKVPIGSTLDFVFWITKNESNMPLDIWDTNGRNGKDYHVKVLNNARPVVIIANFNMLKEEKRLNVLDIAPYLFIAFLTLLLLVHFLIKKLPSEYSPPGYFIKILFTGISLYIFHLLIRITIVAPDLDAISGIHIISAGYYDLQFVSVLTIIFLLLGSILKNRFNRKCLLSIFWALSIISIVIALANVDIVQNLGRPFNYQWFYYSDFMGSTEAKNVFAANLSLLRILKTILFCVCMIMFAQLGVKIFSNLNLFETSGKVIFLPGMFLGLIILSQSVLGERKQWLQGELANPVNSFLSSVFLMQSRPSLFTMELDNSHNDFEFTPASLDIDTTGKVKNVLLIVLESAGAEYFDLYGGKYNTTPQLNKYFKYTALFENIYAHAPASNKSLVSILCSIYPWISYQSLTQEHPEFDFPSLSAELKHKGYRTSFFTSSDFKFQRGNEFLYHRQFDEIEDYATIACDEQFWIKSLDYAHGDGIDDECVVDRFIAWVDQDTTTAFFSMLWTVQGHYPYFLSGEEKDFGVANRFQNRYLNAIHHYDEIIGKVIQQLQLRNQLNSTLIVIVGDHGEAFGRHNQSGHGAKIYEENLHVPLLFINPDLFNGERRQTLGGLSDLAPTILNFLGYIPPAEWQGRNLFHDNKREKVYFFAPWSDYLFGYRSGDYKVIFNETYGTTELYHLPTDPLEEHNLALESDSLIQQARLDMAAWIQYHNQFIDKMKVNGLKN